jgi:hypothetical protein
LGGIHPFPSNFEFPWEEKKKGREGGWADELRRMARSSGQKETDRMAMKKEA